MSVVIFDVDDPRVVDGTYDIWGYNRKERIAIAKAMKRGKVREPQNIAVPELSPDSKGVLTVEMRAPYIRKPCLDCGKPKGPFKHGHRWCPDCMAARHNNRKSNAVKTIARWRKANRARHLAHGLKYRQNMSDAQKQRGRVACAKYRKGFGRLKVKTKAAQYEATHRRRRKGEKLQRRYGLTLEQYDAMVQSQRGACAICKDIPKLLVVDHCHSVGDVRGLLCRHCNNLLGYARDNVRFLADAILYIERFQREKDAA